MVEEKQLISGIDIGTTKIAVVIAEWIKPDNKINILGCVYAEEGNKTKLKG